MQILRNKLEEKKKEALRPDLVNEGYRDLVYAEIETLRSVVAEIYDTERRREFIKQQEHKEKEKEKKNVGPK